MANVEIGNLYDMNKELVIKKEKSLSPTKLREAIETVTKFMGKTENTYFMLLCHERRDYTIFKSDKTVEGNKYNAQVLVDEIITCRGDVRGVDLTEDGSGIEIWIVIDNEAYCYMFFPCDPCVIDEV